MAGTSAAARKPGREFGSGRKKMKQSVVFRCVVAAGLLISAAWMQAQTTPLPPGTSAPGVNAPTSAATYLSEAEAAIAQRQYDHAVALLSKAEAIEPAESLEN